MPFSFPQYVKVIESVTAKDLEAFIPHLISSLCYECLFHGNISKEVTARKRRENTEL